VIWAAGTDDQKKEWLPRYASGETVAEAAFTEPQSGSDVARFRTVARKDGDDYIVNGSKIWVTNGSICTMPPTVVKMDLGKDKTGLSILLIDADSKGVTRSKGFKSRLLCG
jgi:alkylation response protein AidB-like acyl-CoA dehydrogenase